jgi:hypothetical protein
MEKRLNEQEEATRAMNETLNKFIAIMGNQETARNIAPPPPVSPPHVTTPLQASQPSRVKLGVPSHFDRDRVQGRAFLTSCKLYISLTQSDFVDEQVRIHWALSYFKGRHAASFAKRILWQELRSGKMCFTSWHDFTEEFAATFCPENEATTALMQLESNRYYQSKRTVETLTNSRTSLTSPGTLTPSQLYSNSAKGSARRPRTESPSLAWIDQVIRTSMAGSRLPDT